MSSDSHPGEGVPFGERTTRVGPAGGRSPEILSLGKPGETLLPPGRGLPFAVLMVAAAFLSTLALGGLSEGTHHLDDISHHLLAWYAWRDGRFLLHEWGRPGFTILYFPLAWAGMFGSRLTSAIISAATAWLAYRVAGRLGIRRPYLVPLVLYVQPMFLRLAYTSLTETPLGLYLILALYLWVSDRPVPSGAVLSMAVVTRYEACVWVALWGVALAARRRWRALAVLAWAPLAYNLLSYLFLGSVPFEQFLKPGGEVYFGRGTLLCYVIRLPLVCGLGLVPLAVGGLLVLPRRRGALLLAMSAATYFAAETVVYATGSYSSGGYPRFLVPLCPVLAVSACAAVDWLLDGAGSVWAVGLAALIIGGLLATAGYVERRHATPDELFDYQVLFTWSVRLGLWLAVVGGLMLAFGRRAVVTWGTLQTAAAILFLITVFQTANANRPFQLGPIERGLKLAARFVRDRYPGRRTISFNPWYPYFAREFQPYPTRRMIEGAPVGTIVVWDWKLAPSVYHRVTEAWLAERLWLREVWRWPTEWNDPGAYVRVFEKVPKEPWMEPSPSMRSAQCAVRSDGYWRTAHWPLRTGLWLKAAYERGSRHP